MCVGKIGLESDRLLILCHGLSEFAQFLEHDAEVVVCLNKIGFMGDRLLILIHGLVEFALVSEDVAKVVVDLEKARLESYRAP